jgi:predicted dehydrogenase
VRALVVGYGSIGARHARLLAALGCDVGVVSGREIDHPKRYSTLVEGLQRHEPGYVVLASATNLHRPQLTELGNARFAGITMVEKPLFDDAAVAQALPVGPVYVAYNLRFHPLIAALRTQLAAERVLSVQAYVGQYLPTWRPGTDYRTSYSASASRGGGVLRDLSHEFDYLTWLLGGWSRVTALGGRFSDLEIDSDDVFGCLFQTPACPVVSVQLNYLDRAGRRSILVNTATRTIEADMIRSTLTVDRETSAFPMERDDTYLAMHQALLGGDAGTVCSFEEGMRTLRFIEAARRGALCRQWVVNV